jgi:hypothetical protein
VLFSPDIIVPLVCLFTLVVYSFFLRRALDFKATIVAYPVLIGLLHAIDIAFAPPDLSYVTAGLYN